MEQSTSVAAANDYEEPGNAEDSDHDYTELSNICMETDAIPILPPPQKQQKQVSEEVPQQEEPGLQGRATPRDLNPQQEETQCRHHHHDHQHHQGHPQTRDENARLSHAISGDPRKDFEADFVVKELSQFEGWTSEQEEQKVVRLLRPHVNTDGYYVIWYWSLAMRPVVSIAQGGKLISFIVHKSPRAPTTYHFNRRQRKCHAMGDLLRYHLTHGMLYRLNGSLEQMDIRLTIPYTPTQAETSS